MQVNKYLNGFVDYSKTPVGQIAYEKEIFLAKDFELLADKANFKLTRDEELAHLMKRYFSIPIGIKNRTFLKLSRITI